MPAPLWHRVSVWLVEHAPASTVAFFGVGAGVLLPWLLPHFSLPFALVLAIVGSNAAWVLAAALFIRLHSRTAEAVLAAREAAREAHLAGDHILERAIEQDRERRFGWLARPDA